MKNVIYILIFISFSVPLLSQTLALGCTGGGTACCNVDPETLQNYIANTTDGTFTNYSKSFKWVIIPTNSVSFTNPSDTTIWQGSNLSTFKWKNVPNSPQRKIKVTVRWILGTDTISRTDEKVVTIKHIAPITSMSFSGAISTTVSSSGQTVPLPCSTNPLTITVPTPFTDPSQTVIYTWNLNGWSGSSTSNTIVVTPLAGGDKTISVDARRTDGTFIQSFNVTLSRASFEVTKPIISDYFSPGTELNALCVNVGRFYLSTSTNATTYKWSVSPLGTLTFPYGNTTQATAVVPPSENSKVTLTVEVSNNCGIATAKSTSQDVYIGKSEPTPTVNWGPLYYPNYIQNPCFLRLSTDETGVSYNWQVINGTGNIYGSGDPAQVYVYAYPFVRVEGIATNQCGSYGNTFYLYNGSPYYRMASTNPTQSTISVEIEKELAKLALVSVKLVSHGRNAVERLFTSDDARRTNHFERSNKIDFDVANLPRGTYYLLVDFKDTKTQKEIIVLN